MIETTVNVTLPELGESVSEGSIVEWRKRVGDWIEAGETLVDVTTDKVDVEIPAPASGVLTKLLADEGATVAVGAALAEINTAAEKPEGAASAAPPAAAPAARNGNGNGSSLTPPAPTTLATPSSYGEAGTPNGPPERVGRAGGMGGPASHQAKRAAERAHVDISKVRGSGPDGLILREDVERAAKNGSATMAASAGAALPPPPVPAAASMTALKGPAAALAGYMEQSLSIPTATSFRTFGVATLETRRSRLNNALKAANRSEKLSFTHLIAYALVQGAREIPGMTTSFRRDNGTPQKVEAGIHLGIAVDAERKDGTRFLVVPVIKSADRLDFPQFRAAYDDLVKKARDGKLGADELTGATFTLTNPGGIGTVASVPRLMAGQGAIIAAGAIGYPPGFQHANPQSLQELGVEKIMTLTSTYDHRVVQGAQSGEYLRRVEELLAGASSFYEKVADSLGVALDGSAGGAATAVAAPVAADHRSAAALPASVETVPSQQPELLRAVAAGMAIVSAYRTHGHLAATLDPLGREPVSEPALDPRTYGLGKALQSAVPASVLRVRVPGDTLADVLPHLRETYSSTIAYELEHISDTEQRQWMRDYIESSRHRHVLSNERKIQLLERLTKVETMERFLRKTFMSQKTFSIEGVDVMIPMLEETMGMLADDGVNTAVIGMAHRGRLSTIAHVVNRPYEEILSEFEAASMRGEGVEEELDAMGDVKYHHGAQGTYYTPAGGTIEVELAHNPSHLEAVDGVIEGMTRALQTDHSHNEPTLDFQKAVPIMIHGDAAFMGQGIVSEVLNLQSLEGYTTGGTVHLIANNQIGFTSDPTESRSTRYASDLAKGFDVPIVHVNADDVDACISAVHLALDFRRKFGRDTLIDIIGYRRFGHNEQDEPAYTQPQMYDAIKAHPTVRELFAAQLVAQGILTSAQVAEISQRAADRIGEAHTNVKTGNVGKLIGQSHKQAASMNEPVRATGVERNKLVAFSDALITTPQGFTLGTKLARQFERRKASFLTDGEADWGLSEGLAFASLLTEGVPVRITGQDTERGTFSHRHAVFTDPKTGGKFVPLQHIEGATASFEIHNSPLSEYACLGFEYGYSSELPNGLILWEAQFGDFNNGAQIIIDQFISAGLAKWGQTSRLTLLLPHGYEGAGPEHSSARLERFLQLSAESNFRVANCSTAANYFHLLRWQAKMEGSFPLVVMTPKSLLRSRASYGKLDELVGGQFRPVIDDPKMSARRDDVKRIIFCSGKVYYDLLADAAFEQMTQTAVVRVELIAPLPTDEMLAIIKSYPNASSVVWVQEEPKNMGARAHVRRRLVERLPKRIKDIDYVGRPYRASPSEGYPGAHAVEQDRIVRAALTE